MPLWNTRKTTMHLALFDLDHTLLSGDSDVEWPGFLIKKGIVDAAYYSRESDRFYEQYKDGTLDIYAFLDFQLSPLAGRDRAELEDVVGFFLNVLPVRVDVAGDGADRSDRGAGHRPARDR